MKRSKILPTAAGIIALTACITFARDGERIEETRSNTAVSTLKTDIALTQNKPSILDSDSVYLVTIAQGVTAKEMTIDAYTGKILKQRDLNVSTT